MKKYIMILVVVFMLFSLVSCVPRGLKASDTDIKLLDGIETGNLEECKEALESGAHIDQLVGKIGERTDNGALEKNPFRIACFLGKTKIAKFLLEQGADPNVIDAEGFPVLCYVVKIGDINLCKLMLGKGADINQKGKNGLTPLDCCFLQDNSGQPDNKRDFAVEKMYDFLIENGAELSANTLKNAMEGLDNDGYTRYNIIQKIVKQLVNSSDKTNLDVVLEAIILGDNQKFQLLAQKAKKIDEKCLFFAAAFGTQKSLELLVEKGMCITAKDADDNVFLTISAKSGNVSMLEYLIPKFDLSGDDGYKALLAATSNNQSETANILIKRKAKIASNTTDTFMGDMLSYACMNNNSDIAKLLIENGYPKDGYNQALQTASQYNQVEILQYLINAGFDVNNTFNEETALGVASFWGSIDCVKLLVASGAKVNGVPDLATPLSKACYMGQTEVVKFLIENGANVNAQPADVTGQLPLQQAIMSGSFDIVKLLIEHDAKIDDTIVSLAESFGSINVYNYLKSVK